jgi:hypothetical protein
MAASSKKKSKKTETKILEEELEIQQKALRKIIKALEEDPSDPDGRSTSP